MRSSEFTINNFQFTINPRGLRALGIVLTSLHERADISWGSEVCIRSRIHPWTNSPRYSASEYKFSMKQIKNSYDLEERTAKFGENIILFCRTLKPDVVSRPIIGQVVRSGTSIGANYMEANAACSKRDFQNKIYICKKEAQETKHWLRMLLTCFPERREEITRLWKEAQELTMIFQKITSSLKK